MAANLTSAQYYRNQKGFHTAKNRRFGMTKKSQRPIPVSRSAYASVGWGRETLDLASWTSCKFAHLHHQARALHGIELEDELRNLGDKRIADQ